MTFIAKKKKSVQDKAFTFCPISLVSFNLKHFLCHSMTSMTFMYGYWWVLFYRMSLHLGFFFGGGYFLMVSCTLFIFGQIYSDIVLFSLHSFVDQMVLVLSFITSGLDLDLPMMILMFLQYKITFSFLISILWGASLRLRKVLFFLTLSPIVSNILVVSCKNYNYYSCQVVTTYWSYWSFHTYLLVVPLL